MNIEKLIESAKEIDRLAQKQEERARRFGELAARARKADPEELRRIQDESRSLSGTVVDYGDALIALRRALKAKPTRTIGP